jgi:hypothetical protein
MWDDEGSSLALTRRRARFFAEGQGEILRGVYPERSEWAQDDNRGAQDDNGGGECGGEAHGQVRRALEKPRTLRKAQGKLFRTGLLPCYWGLMASFRCLAQDSAELRLPWAESVVL